jgi:hypothetical protein
MPTLPTQPLLLLVLARLLSQEKQNREQHSSRTTNSNISVPALPKVVPPRFPSDGAPPTATPPFWRRNGVCRISPMIPHTETDFPSLRQHFGTFSQTRETKKPAGVTPAERRRPTETARIRQSSRTRNSRRPCPTESSHTSLSGSTHDDET